MLLVKMLLLGPAMTGGGWNYSKSISQQCYNHRFVDNSSYNEMAI